MRFIFILAFIAGLIAVATSHRCPMACKRNLHPTCGIQFVNGVWKEKIFANECEMRNENECLGGRYIPCREEEE